MSEKQGCSGTAIAIISVSFFALLALGAGGAFFAYKSVSSGSSGNEEALREFVRASAVGEQTAARVFIAQAAVDATTEGAVLASITALGGYGAMQTFEVESTGFQSNLGMPTVWSYTVDVTFERGEGDLEFGVIKIGDDPRIQSFSYNIRPTNGQPVAATPPTPPTGANLAATGAERQQADSIVSEADATLVRTFFDAAAARNFRGMFALMSTGGQAALDQRVTNTQISELPNWGPIRTVGTVTMERSIDSAEFGRVREMTLSGDTATTTLRLTLEVGRENGSPVAHRFDLNYDPIAQPAGGKP
ncbi:MAG: hypothetical protein ACJA1R_002229 [Flavobacteriales bacterium]|jgi:hypothetical protein